MTDLLGLGSAHAFVIAIAALIWGSLVLGFFVLPLVAFAVPAILILVSRRGSAATRGWYALGSVIACVALFGVANVVTRFVPSWLSRVEEYGISWAFWAAGIIAPWILWLVFLVRTTDRGVGPARP